MTLTSLLRAETEAATELHGLLQQEYSLLQGRDVDTLETLLGTKQECLIRLQALTEQRQKLLAPHGSCDDAYQNTHGVERWLEASRKAQQPAALAGGGCSGRRGRRAVLVPWSAYRLHPDRRVLWCAGGLCLPLRRRSGTRGLP